MIGLEISEAEVARAGDELNRWVLTELKAALADETRGLEQDIEKITRLAVRGKLWRAFASKVYPDRPRSIAKEPEGRIYINGKRRSTGAITFFTQEGRISRGGGGKYLCIPTDAAGVQDRTKRFTPTDWQNSHGQKLRFIRTERGAVLVAENITLSGRRGVAKPAGQRTRANRRTSAIIFILVPFVDFRARFSIAPLQARRQAMLQANIETRIGRRHF